MNFELQESKLIHLSRKNAEFGLLQCSFLKVWSYSTVPTLLCKGFKYFFLYLDNTFHGMIFQQCDFHNIYHQIELVCLDDYSEHKQGTS